MEKWIGISCGVVTCLLYGLGCGGDGWVGYMPGTYVNSAGGAYAVADDTLSVVRLSGDSYVIDRSTGYNMRQGDTLGLRRQEKEKWRAVVDRERGILLEQRWGKELRFDRKRNCLEIGHRVYRKVD